jgi:dienelactone hydrolase
MRLITGMGVLLMAGASAFALTGTVKDNKGAALAGAIVSFVSDTSIHQTTNANGEFTLNKTVSIFRAGAPGQNFTRLAIQGERLQFSIAASVQSGALTLFAGNGKKRLEIPLGPMEPGNHQLSLPKLAPGLYFMQIALDGFSGIARLVHTGAGSVLAGNAPGSPNASALRASALRRMSAAAAAVDTVRAVKTGFTPVNIPVTAYEQTGLAIVMNPDSGSVPGLPPITDYTANGPFNTVVEANVGPGNAYTIFRPEPLGANGFMHAPMIYGHGIGGQVSGFANFLKIVASHGFVVIGCNILNGGPNSPANNTAMTTGLNWILQQNTTAGSKFQGKLAVTRAVSMGYSVGGTAAVDIGGHEAIRTVVSIHGHISTATLHGTLLQTSGTKDNVGLPMQQQTFTNSKVQTFLGTVTNADHGYISQNNGGAERPAIVAWLRYWIYNDTGAKNYFYGNDCVMCKAPWENPQRKNWN